MALCLASDVDDNSQAAEDGFLKLNRIRRGIIDEVVGSISAFLYKALSFIIDVIELPLKLVINLVTSVGNWLKYGVFRA